MTSDTELFERWSDGDEAAGEELFRRYFEAIARELAKLAQGPVLESLTSRLDEWAAELRRQLPTGS